jgi:hypothetical protein
VLIDINNAIGPYLGEICAVFYLIASVALLRTWKKSRTPDALVVFFYLTALIAAVYLPNTWLNLFSLTVFHLFGYTVLVWLHATQGYLRTIFGDYFLLMAGLMGLSDAVFLGWGFPIQCQVWVVDAIFITMCIGSLYVCFNSNHNGGNLGKRHELDSKHHKSISGTVEG